MRQIIADTNSKTTLYISKNYIAFLKMITNSLYDFINGIIYAGFTDDDKNTRISTYVRNLQQLLDGTLILEKVNNNSCMLSSLLENWKAGSECFIQYISESQMMSKKEGLFMERALIAALKWLPINCNRNHGMTDNHRNIIQIFGVTEDLITQIGIGELVHHFKRNQFAMELAKPIKLFDAHNIRIPTNTLDRFL